MDRFAALFRMFCFGCLRLCLVTAWRLCSRVSIYPLQHRRADDSREVDNDDWEGGGHQAQSTAQPTFKNIWNTRNLELCHDGSIYAFSLPAKLSCNFQFPVIWWMSRNTLFSKFVENWKILGNLSWVPGLLTNCNKTTSPQQQFVTNMKIFGARF